MGLSLFCNPSHPDATTDNAHAYDHLERDDERSLLLKRGRQYARIKVCINIILFIALLAIFLGGPAERKISILVAMGGVVLDGLGLLPYLALLPRRPLGAIYFSFSFSALAVAWLEIFSGYLAGASGFFYLLLLAAFGFVLARPGHSYVMATLTTVLYLGTAGLEFSGVVPLEVPLPHFHLIVSMVVFTVLSLYSLATITDVILSTLARTNRELRSAALENARLYQLEQTRRHLADTLLEVSETVSASLDLEEVLEIILDQLGLVVEYDSAAIMLLEDQTLQITASRGFERSDYPGFAFSLAGREHLQRPLQTGQPLIIDDVHQEPSWEYIESTKYIHSWIGVPLISGEKTIGLLTIDHKTSAYYQPEDGVVARAFANQAAIAIENARLYEKAQQGLRDLSVLFEAGQAASATLSAETVVLTMAEYMTKAIGVHGCAISLWDEETDTITALADYTDLEGRGPDEQVQDVGHPYPLSNYPATKKLLLSREPLVVDVDDPDADEYERQLLSKFEWRVMLALPMVVKDRVIGLAELYDYRPGRRFSEREVYLSQALANQTAMAIENAQLYQATDRNLTQLVRELSTIDEIDRELSATLDFQRVIDLVLERAMEATGATAGAVALCQESRDTIDFISHRGYPQTFIETYRAQLWSTREGITGRVVRTGQPSLIPDVSQDPDYLAAVPAIRSELAVPIIRQGQVIGAINLESLTLAAFNEDHLRFVERLADHAALAIKNAQLYEDTQTKMREMAALLEAGQAITSLELSGVLSVLVEKVAQALDAEQSSVYLVDKDTGYIVPQAVYGLGHLEYDQVAFAPGEGTIGWVVENALPLLSEDAQHDPRFKPKAGAALQLRTILTVPLVFQGEVIGALEACNKRSIFGFSPGDQDLLIAFANQVAAAIANAQLYQDEQRRAREMVALNQVAQAISSVLDLSEVTDLLVERAVAITSAEAGLLVLRDPAGGLRVLAQRGHPQELVAEYSRAWDSSRGVIGRVMRSGQVALVPDVQRDPDYVPLIRAGRSELTVPIWREEEVIGALNLESKRPAAFSQEDLSFLTHLAEHAAIAIENARLYEAAEHRAEELATLNEIAHTVTSTLDLQNVFKLVMEKIGEIFRVERGSLLILDEQTQELYFAWTLAEHVEELNELADFRVKLGQGIVGCVAQTGEPAIVHDVEQDPRHYAAVSQAVGFNVRSILCVPLVFKGRVIGAIELLNKIEGHFGQEDIGRLNAIAAPVAIAIENARLYDEERRRAEELAGLHRISQAIGAVTDIRQVYEQLTERIGTLAGVEMCGVLLYDDDNEALLSQPPFYGVPAEMIRFYRIPVTRDSQFWQIWQDYDYFISNDVLRDPLVAEAGLSDLARLAGVRATLLAPMTVGKRRIGIVQASNKLDGSPFNEDDARLVSIFANQAAAIVENARLYSLTDEQLRERVDELTALQHIVQELNATLELQPILDLVLDECMRITSATHGNIALLDREDNSERSLFRVTVMRNYTAQEEEQLRTARLGEGEGVTDEVIRSGQPQIIPDTDRESRFVCFKPETRSALVVPIFYEKEVVGSINLRSDRPQTFNQHDLDFVQALADQAAIAIGNAQRYEEQVRRGEILRRRTGQMARLFQIGRAVRMDRPLESILEDIAFAVQETVGFNMALIGLVEGDPHSERSLLRWAAAAGVPLPTFHEMQERRLPVANLEAAMDEQFRISQSYLIPHGHETLWEKEAALRTLLEDRSATTEGPEAERWHPVDMLLVPLRGTDGRVLGLMTADDPRDGRRPARSVIEALETFASQAAMAIENTRLYEGVSKRLAQVSSLQAVSTAMVSTLELEKLLELIVEQATNLLDGEGGVLNMCDLDRNVEEVVATVGSAKPEQGVKDSLGDTLSGWVAIHNQPLICNDLAAEPRASRRGIEAMKARTAVFAPLQVQERVIGSLVVLDKEKGQGEFNQDDLDLLVAFANQAAITIENARLYEQELHRAREAETLAQIGLAMASSLDLPTVLNAIAEGALKLVKANNINIFLYDEESQQFTFGAGLWDTGHQVTPALPRQDGLTVRVVASERPVVIHHASEHPLYAALGSEDLGMLAQFPRLEAVAGFPIRRGPTTLGAFNVSFTVPHIFSQDELDILAFLANQAAIAIENARLYEEAKVRADEMSALYETSLDIAAQLDLPQLLHSIMERAAALLGAKGGMLYIYDEASEELELIESYNLSQELVGVRLKRGEGLSGKILASGEPMIVGDYRTWAGRSEKFAGQPVGSVLGMPLRWGGRIVGVITIFESVERAFSDEDMRLLGLFANQAAIAIENARLYSASERRIEELTALHQIGVQIGAQLDPKTLLNQISRNAMELLKGDSSCILLLDENREYLTIQGSAGMGEEVVKGTRDRLGESIAGRVAMTSQPIIANDLPHDPRFYNPAASGEQWLAIISTPMFAGDEIIGTLDVHSRTRLFAFTEEHLQILSLLANQAAIAIANARLFGEVERRAQQLMALHSIGRTTSLSFDLGVVLKAVLQSISDIMGFEYVTISLVDEEKQVVEMKHIIWQGEFDAYPDWMAMSRYPLDFPDILTDIVRTGQTEIIDTWDERFNREIWDKFGHERLFRIFMPIKIKERVLGTLEAGYDKSAKAYVSDEEVRTLEAFVDQAAIAIESAHLFQETFRRAEEMRLLYDFGVAVSASLDLDEVLTLVVENALRLTHTELGLIFVLDRVTGDYVQHMATDVPDSLLPLPADKPRPGKLTDIIVENGKPIIIPEVRDDPRLGPTMRKLGMRAVAGVPVESLGQAIGALFVGSTQPRSFPERQISSLSFLTNQAAVSIRNAQLYQEISRFSQELECRVEERTKELDVANRQLTLERDRVETLYRITSELSASLDLDRVLTQALVLVNEAVGVEHGSIMLLDRETDNLIYRAALGRKEALPRGGKMTPYRRGVGLAGWVLEHREAVIIEDVSQDERYIVDDGKEAQSRAALAVPLTSGDDILGVLLLFHPQPGFFSQTHLKLVSAAATQLATAINNAELYRLIRESSERLGDLLRATQAEASKSRAILEGIADGVLVTDSRGDIILFNEAAGRILNLKSVQALHRSIHQAHTYADHSPPAARSLALVSQWMTEAQERIPAAEKLEMFEQQIETAGLVINVRIAPAMMGDEFVGAVALFRDITREVEVERLKSEFISTVSHELRTPMTSIKGYTDLLFLETVGDINQAQRNFLQIIKSNADRLTLLVNDILDISRIEMGRIRLDLKPLPIKTVIEEVVTSLSEQVQEKNLSITLEVPEDLPPVKGDHDRVTQILVNLISNAYQYTPRGGRITISAQQQRAFAVGGALQVNVADTGIGISPEDQEKIFDPFYRAEHPLVQESGGTGLGLNIVKSFVEMQGGEIWVESELDQGSTFSFTLPLANGEPTADGNKNGP